MDKAEIRGYRERSKNILEESPQMNEANTKKKIIDPLLMLMGWNLYSSEIKLEYPVQSGSTSKNVDYALILNDNPVVFVEAKGSGTEIRDRDIKQLKSYMKLDDVGFGLISNGKTFKVLKTEWGEKQTEVTLLGSLSLDEISDKLHFLEILSKKAVESGKSETIAKNIEKSRRAVEKLRENKGKIVNGITKIIEEEIEEFNPDKIKNQSDKFVEELISTFSEPVRERVSTEERKVPKVSREELEDYKQGEVIVCPSKPDGVDFLLQYRAWGFNWINRDPDYIAIYVSESVSESVKQVKYFAKVKEIVDPRDEEYIVPNYEEYEHYEPGKKLVVLEENSLSRLETPVLEGDETTLRSLRYSTVENFISAETVDDLF